MKVTKDFYEDFEIDLSTLCDLKCPLCTRNYKHSKHLFNGSKSGRPLNEIIDQLNTFPNLKHGSIAGLFSEPTLYKDFLNFIKYLKTRKIKLELHTHGGTHDNEFWIKVANMLEKDDTLTLTICGSTQEIHEKYRVGSSLKRVIEVANIVKKHCKYNNLVIQVLKFEYNINDTQNILDMLLPFENIITIYSEGLKTAKLTDFINKPDTNITPPTTQLKTLNAINKIKYGKGGKINCAFYKLKKITIGSDGTESACHIQSEFNIPFYYDYKHIFNYDYNSCVICEESTISLLDKLNLDGVA